MPEISAAGAATEAPQKQPIQSHIAALDGVRTLAILGVAAYHFWQQSWLQYVGEGFFSAHSLPYPTLPMHFIITGDAQVDIMVLLSAFLLALPYARYRCGTAEELPAIGNFYRRRVARIVPSVYFALLVVALLFVRPSQYGGMGPYLKDLLSHTFFVSVYDPSTLFWTKFPGTLWTLSVEVAFYLVFPFLGRAFVRRPMLTWGGMQLCYAVFWFILAKPAMQSGDDVWGFTPPAFLPLYATGMLAAWGYAELEKRNIRSKWFTASATAALFLSGWALCQMLCEAYRHDSTRIWRMEWRFAVAAAGGAFLVSLCFSARFIRAIFGNRFTKWFAAISFNFYIWHQTLALWMKNWRIPWYPDAPADAYAWPQQADGEAWHTVWQWQYTAVCWLVGIVVAVLCTEFIEKPAAKFINNLKLRKPATPPVTK